MAGYFSPTDQYEGGTMLAKKGKPLTADGHHLAQLLNELMGSDRNSNPNEKKREIRFDDPEICKYFLCGFCPHDLFTNTRADLGLCTQIHDEEIQKKYQTSSRFEKMGYEEDFIRYLHTLLSEVEKRIRKGHARLSLNSTTGSMLGGPQVLREEKNQMLTEKINELVEQAEQLGCEGKVEEAQGVMKLCEQLREERAQLQSVGQRPDQSTSKDMEVCDICGALLVVGDAQQRIDEHIMGKQHMGYAQIRSYIEKYKQKQQGEEAERTSRLKMEREEREREREHEREERQRKREERERERREKEKRRRKRSRSRSRDRRQRSRSRSRSHRRSRSRSRHRRTRSRDRRTRSRDRKRTPTRSHDYDCRSNRDKDRKRSRSRSVGSIQVRSHDRDYDKDNCRDENGDARDRKISRDDNY